MALYLLLLPILITAMTVSAQDEIPFNTTGLTEIFVQQHGSSIRHHRQFGSPCNRNRWTVLTTGDSCVFTSLRFPNMYPRGSSRFFFKSWDHSCNIQIECSDFQLPESSSCSSRSTNLFMKWGRNRNEWKRFCGSNIPTTVVSSSYWAYAGFYSYHRWNRSYRGFNCTASTICPTTAVPTTVATAAVTTSVSTTDAPTTDAVTTTAPSTVAPTTAASTTAAQTTVATATIIPTTSDPTTTVPTTAEPTTAASTTDAPTTVAATTTVPTTADPTTDAPVTATLTTDAASTTPTTVTPTTADPTTVAVTSADPATTVPTTSVGSTA